MAFGVGDVLQAVTDFFGIPGLEGGAKTGGIQLTGNTPVTGLLYNDDSLAQYLPTGFKADDEFSIVNPRNFWQIYPYQFVIMVEGEDPSSIREYIYTLPIPPESLQTKMVMASEATPTLGGVVEETSQNKLWMVSLSGTTGMAVGRGDESGVSEDTAKAATKFRNIIGTTGLLAGLSAAVNEIGGQVAGIASGISQFASSPGAGIANTIQAALLPNLPYASSAVSKKSNGYSEIARMQRFFYMYSVYHEGAPNKVRLEFRNVKDNQRFRCVIKDFQVTKGVQEPYLYRYRITAKCWQPRDLKGVDEESIAEINRFDPATGDMPSVNTLTAAGSYALTVKKINDLSNIGSTITSSFI